MTVQDWTQVKAPGEDYITPAPALVRATPADAGCWCDGAAGIYAAVRMVTIAMNSGWVSPTHDMDVALLEWWRDGAQAPAPSSLLASEDVDSLPEYWTEVQNEAEEWLNEAIAPDGYSFGWWDGDFMLASDETWCEWSGDCLDPEHTHPGASRERGR